MDDSLPFWWTAAVGAGAVVAWLLRQPFVIFTEQRKELDHERKRRREAEELSESLRLAAAAVRVEIEHLREREGRLVRSLARIGRLNGVGEAFDEATDGFVVSSAVAGGTWLWANQPFCTALGMSLDAILAAGWKRLAHPDDLRITQRVEGAAWHRRVDGHVVRYRRSESIGGGWVQTRWFCPEYVDGLTYCVVRFEGLSE